MEKNFGIKVNLNPKMNNNNSNPINDKKIQNNSTCNLPKDFFETVLYCEMKLKEKFNMKIFHKLANYYSAAIDYYESINDPKFMLYNQNLSMLFSQTEAKKYFSDGGSIKEKIKKEKNKEKIDNCDKKITTNKVKNFIKKNLESDTKSKINDIINRDISVQENDFKKRLEEKKKDTFCRNQIIYLIILLSKISKIESIIPILLIKVKVLILYLILNLSLMISQI